MDTVIQFETYRPLLFAIAYRMLGSAMEAEDMVQEAYLRYQSTGAQAIHAPKAFLTTVITRLCLNRLASAQLQRETYIGPWLPEPIVTDGQTWRSPVEQAQQYDAVSLAFLTLLETLTPVERAVFLLREVFDYEYQEIAGIVDKSEQACRQLFSRAKKHLADRRPRFRSSPEEHRRLLDRFMEAVRIGEMGGLMQLLADGVTMWADGGGKVRGAATQPLYGPSAVAQFVLGSTRFLQEGYQTQILPINGAPAAILHIAGQAVLVLTIEVGQGQIYAIRVIGNPDKLQRLSSA